MEKILVLKYPIPDGQKVIEFNEAKYNQENKCTLTDKELHVTNECVIITYRIAPEFVVSVA